MPVDSCVESCFKFLHHVWQNLPCLMLLRKRARFKLKSTIYCTMCNRPALILCQMRLSVKIQLLDWYVMNYIKWTLISNEGFVWIYQTPQACGPDTHNTYRHAHAHTHTHTHNTHTHMHAHTLVNMQTRSLQLLTCTHRYCTQYCNYWTSWTGLLKSLAVHRWRK